MIHAPGCASCGVTVSACVVVATGVQGGEVALIRTSPQPLCHFYSGTSLGGPHFIGEVVVVGVRKCLYVVMHYSQHRCRCDPG